MINCHRTRRSRPRHNHQQCGFHLWFLLHFHSLLRYQLEPSEWRPPRNKVDPVFPLLWHDNHGQGDGISRKLSRALRQIHTLRLTLLMCWARTRLHVGNVEWSMERPGRSSTFEPHMFLTLISLATSTCFTRGPTPYKRHVNYSMPWTMGSSSSVHVEPHCTKYVYKLWVLAH